MGSQKNIWWPLLSTNILGVLNDNFLKTLACFIAVSWVGLRYESLLVTAAAAALVLPYVFLSPLAGRWAEIFSKRKVVILCKAAEIGIMLLSSVGFVLCNPWIVISSIFLMGLQSCMFSPSKYGLIRDIGGYERLNEGTGAMEMVSFIGMLSGTLLASFVSSTLSNLQLGILLIFISVSGFVCSLCIRAKESEAIQATSSLRPFKFLWKSYLQAKSYPGLNPLIIGLCVFWLIAAILQMLLIVYCRRTLFMTDIQTGLCLSAAAVGIGAGCAIAGKISSRIWSYRLVLPAGATASLLLLIIYLFRPEGWLFGVLIALMAFCCGIFKVPLDASIPTKTPGRALGIMLAYSNQLSFIFILAASAVYGIFSQWNGGHGIFLFTSLLMIGTLIYLLLFSSDILCIAWRSILHLGYRVNITGLENLPADKTLLFLPNHTSLTDPQILICELYRIPITPLVTEVYFHNPLFGAVLRKLDSIAVPDLEKLHSREAVGIVTSLPGIVLKRLENGKNILLYPSGELARSPMAPIRNKQLAWQICRRLPENVCVVGVRITGLWGSSWSCAATGKTPDIGNCFKKSVIKLLRHGIFFARKRGVIIHFENITTGITNAARNGKNACNAYLDDFYHYL